MATQRLTSRRRQDQGLSWVRIVMAVLATVGVIDTGSITLKFWGVLGDLTCPMGAGGCDISRVLFTLPRKGGDHLSGIAVTDDLERRTLAERGRWPPVVPRPCSQPGFTEPAPLDAAGALLPHLCTLACAGEPAIGGVFLWHSPHGHPHWALPSKPGHRGARTFLNR